jgi:hypothetical protein
MNYSPPVPLAFERALPLALELTTATFISREL